MQWYTHQLILCTYCKHNSSPFSRTHISLSLLPFFCSPPLLFPLLLSLLLSYHSSTVQLREDLLAVQDSILTGVMYDLGEAEWAPNTRETGSGLYVYIYLYVCGIIISVRRELIKFWTRKVMVVIRIHVHAIWVTTRALRWPIQCRQRHETGKGECWTSMARLRSTIKITGRYTSLKLSIKVTHCMEACPLAQIQVLGLTMVITRM